MKPNTVKSYHSSALPITAAATARVFGGLTVLRFTVAMNAPAPRAPCLGWMVHRPRIRRSTDLCLGECNYGAHRYQAMKKARSTVRSARFFSLRPAFGETVSFGPRRIAAGQ